MNEKLIGTELKTNNNYETIVCIVFAVMLAFLCVTTVMIYSRMFQYNEKLLKQKPEIIYMPTKDEGCPVQWQGKCFPVSELTALNCNSIAGYENVYECQVMFTSNTTPKKVEVKK